AWGEIDDYRLEIRHAPGAHEVLYLVDVLGGFLALRDLRDAARGQHRLRFALELRGAGRRIRFSWRDRGGAEAIPQVLARITARLGARADDELAAHGSAAFGPLRIAGHAVQWRDREPLALEAVEAIELFDSTPVALRVMKRGKALPHAQAATRAIPNLLAALDVADRLGYPVRGRELLAPVG
ncbi:MAG TPA: hypothetical protein VFU21_04390, partial [Kofleriaceae bacterium]|nr:hypothetical protein [Kofleriaceae bacterium]